MSDDASLARTPLHDWHVAHGARMVDFAGWSMPVQYGSIVDEHHATRRAAGLFDISHMGRLIVDGPQARAFLDSVLTRRIDDMTPGQVRYSLMCNDAGGVLDDVLVYQIQLPEGGLSTAVTVFGGTGVGSGELVMYPYWCIEKGYARFTGARDAMPGWKGRANGWIRVMGIDILNSLLIYTFATVAFTYWAPAFCTTWGRCR